MKELFAVDLTTLLALGGLLLFVVFVVIYKSKQQGATTYYNDDEAYEDTTEIEEAEEIENKTTEKPEESEEEIEFDIKPVLVVCLIVMYNINKRLDVLGVLWSLVFTVLVSVAISIFVPKEILRRFFPKKPKNNDD